MSSNLRRYGLIGCPLEHSLSPFIHGRIMQAAGIRGEYRLYELERHELSEKLPALLGQLDGVNVTIPYKQAVLPFLRGLAPSAQLYGAVNTVHQGMGHNTDGAGFRACRVPLEGRQVCVLGAGGAARVLAVEAVRAGAREVVIRARRREQAEELAAVVRKQGAQHVRCENFYTADSCEVFLNGTPLGMWPHVAGLPLSPEQIASAQAVFDTVYNPAATRLVLKAKTLGLWARGGLGMLFEQAVAAQKIWNPQVDFNLLQGQLEAVRKELALEVLRHSPVKLVLSGFMGAGKTHIGGLLAERLKMPFVDLDQAVEAEVGLSIPEVFTRWGEQAFRNVERECLAAELKRPGPLVLAAGGGALVQQGAASLVHSAGGLIIHLDISLETALARCAGQGDRPLLKGGAEAAEALYQRRLPLYAAAADLRVNGEQQDIDVVRDILAAFELEV